MQANIIIDDIFIKAITELAVDANQRYMLAYLLDSLKGKVFNANVKENTKPVIEKTNADEEFIGMIKATNTIIKKIKDSSNPEYEDLLTYLEDAKKAMKNNLQ